MQVICGCYWCVLIVWNIVYLFTPRADGVMRTMNTEKLLKTLPIVQNQMDSLLDFNVSWLIVCLTIEIETVGF